MKPRQVNSHHATHERNSVPVIVVVIVRSTRAVPPIDTSAALLNQSFDDGNDCVQRRPLAGILHQHWFQERRPNLVRIPRRNGAVTGRDGQAAQYRQVRAVDNSNRAPIVSKLDLKGRGAVQQRKQRAGQTPNVHGAVIEDAAGAGAALKEFRRSVRQGRVVGGLVDHGQNVAARLECPLDRSGGTKIHEDGLQRRGW